MTKLISRLRLWRLFRIFTGCLIIVLLLFGLPKAQNQAPPSSLSKPPSLQTFDIRTSRTNTALPSGQQRRDLLQHFPDVPGIQASWSSLTGTPSRLFSSQQPLTRPSQKPPAEVAREFLKDHKLLFGLQDADIDQLYVSREYTTDRIGITHLTLQQQLGGINFFNSSFLFNIRTNGEILSVSGEVVSHLSVTVTKPKLRPDDAIRIGAANVDLPLTRSLQVSQATTHPNQLTVFDKGIEFGQDVPVHLVYFPTGLQHSRLAWEVLINKRGSPDVYRLLIDVEDGSLLFRDNRTNY